MSVDPVDDYTFWFTQEYMNGGWKTRIGAFDFGPVLPPEISAGADTTMCENTLFVANASATYVSSVFWESDGDGRFVPDPPVHLIQGYIRGTDDIENGGFTLNVVAEGFEQGMEDYDTIAVAITRLPEAFAGNDTVVPAFSSVTLNGNATDASAVEWSTNGDGFFDDPTLLDATYTPGDGDIAEGLVKLTLTALPLTPCDEDDSDLVKVTLDHTIGFDESPDKEFGLKVVPNPSTGEFSLNITDMQAGKGTIKIHNQVGEVLFEQQIAVSHGTMQKQFNLSSQPKGIYFVTVRNAGQYRVEKVVIR
jgi:hypothetical protein